MKSQLMLGLIPVLVPVLIAGLKVLAPRIPRPLLPIIAPLLGGLADAAISWASGGTANPVLGMALGSAGVGLREIVDQFCTEQSAQSRAPRSLLLALCALLLALGASGCATPRVTLPSGTASVLYANARADYAVAKILISKACQDGKWSAADCEAAKQIDVKAQVYRQAIEASLLNPEQPIDWAQVLQYSESVVGLLLKLGVMAAK